MTATELYDTLQTIDVSLSLWDSVLVRMFQERCPYISGTLSASYKNVVPDWQESSRSRKKLDSTGFKLDKRVVPHEPLGFHDYNCLQMNAFCVISDSGTLPEESSFYTSIGHAIPAVCIRDSTERPEAIDKGCFVLAGVEDNTVLQSVELAIDMVKNGDNGIPVPDYTDLNVSNKVVKIIQSYVGIINKNVWRKE